MQHESAPTLVDEPFFSSGIQKLTLGLLIVSGGVIAAFLLWSSYLSSREESVHLAFVAAKSPEEKQKIADENKTTVQAALIYLNLAHAALDEKPQDALHLYDSFLTHHQDHLLANAAYLGKAKALETLQKPQEALLVYQTIVKSKKVDAYVPLALLSLSRLHAAQDQVAEARQNLQDLLIGYADYATEAKERLKMLPEHKS